MCWAGAGGARGESGMIAFHGAPVRGMGCPCHVKGEDEDEEDHAVLSFGSC